MNELQTFSDLPITLLFSPKKRGYNQLAYNQQNRWQNHSGYNRALLYINLL